ncbi:hypothetical protein CN327_25505 [Bacillus cereus]|nr:hypothetical protein CN327_25505 [Bacillus cereus]
MDLQQYFSKQGYATSDKLQALRATADAIVNLGETQTSVSHALGISSRTLRTYISDNRAFYDGCIKEFQENKGVDNPKLTEAHLDAFVNNIIQMGAGSNPSPKEMELFIKYFDISSEQVNRLINNKGKTLRGYLKESEADFLDKRDMATVLESMDVLYLGTKETMGATQRFVDMDTQDDLTKLRLMYTGLLFMSLFNQVEHPDLAYLGDLVRIEQIKQEVSKPKVDTKAIKAMANVYEPDKPMDTAKMIDFIVTELGMTLEDATALLNAPKKQAKAFVPDREYVRAEAKNHREDLQVFLSVDEEVMAHIKNQNTTKRGY